MVGANNPSIQYSINPILQYSIDPLIQHSITPSIHHSNTRSKKLLDFLRGINYIDLRP
jgi:hypothetical protein